MGEDHEGDASEALLHAYALAIISLLDGSKFPQNICTGFALVAVGVDVVEKSGVSIDKIANFLETSAAKIRAHK